MSAGHRLFKEIKDLKELICDESLSEVDTPENIIVFALDYDGCLTNNIYYAILCHLFLWHFDQLEQIAKVTATQLRKADYAVINTIKSAIAQFDTEDDKFEKLRENVLIKAKKRALDAQNSMAVKNLMEKLWNDNPENEDVTFYEYINKLSRLMDAVDASLLQSVFMKANQKLFQFISQQIAADNPDKVIVVNFSSRQDYDLDSRGKIGNGTGSAFEDLTLVENEIRAIAAKTGKKIAVEKSKLCMADIHGCLAHGTSFDRINRQNQHPDLVHAEHVYDDTKFTLAYAGTHHISREYKNAHIRFHVLDNLYSIIYGEWDEKNEQLSKYGLYTLYARANELLPSNIKLRLHIYDGDFCFAREIAGSGGTNDRYEDSVRHMVEMSRAARDAKQELDPLNLDVGNDLEPEQLKSYAMPLLNTRKRTADTQYYPSLTDPLHAQSCKRQKT